MLDRGGVTLAVGARVVLHDPGGDTEAGIGRQNPLPVLGELSGDVQAVVFQVHRLDLATEPLGVIGMRVLRVGELEMNLITRQVKRQSTLIDLQPREFQLLEFLMRHAGQSVTRTMLLEKVWAYHFDPQTNVIDVHISRLRAKLDKGFDRAMLHTVRGEGYQLKA